MMAAGREPRSRTAGGRSFWPAVGLAVRLGLTMGGSVIAGVLLGFWLDRQAGTEPWLLILLTVAGVVGGFIGAYEQIKRVIS